jgi:hypothetical protein
VLPVVVLAGLAGPAAPVAAVSFELTAAQRAEAIELGQRSITRESVGEEWERRTSAGDITVMTPFYRLALAARQAAFRQKPLSPRDVERTLRADAGRLVFWVSLPGRRPDFARFYRPELEVAGGSVRPSFVQNERTALPQADGAYLARCVYGFPVGRLPRAAARVVLVVRDEAGTEVARFPLDLAAIR